MRLSQLSFTLPIHSRLKPALDLKPTRFIRKRLAMLGGYLWDWMVSSHEPMIEEKCDRNGYLYWRVYDPMTQDLRCFDSEDAVRVWLDQRYYQ